MNAQYALAVQGVNLTSCISTKQVSLLDIAAGTYAAGDVKSPDRTLLVYVHRIIPVLELQEA